MANAVWTDLCNAVQAGIQALGLTYAGGTLLPAGSVVVRKLPTDRGLTLLPAIVVSLGQQERYDDGDFEDIVVDYPVLVCTLFATNQVITLNDDELRWRQQILDMGVEFVRTIRDAVTSADVSQCRIDPHPAVDLSNFQANLDVNVLALWFRATRARSR
jgi:hypothetical protein